MITAGLIANFVTTDKTIAIKATVLNIEVTVEIIETVNTVAEATIAANTKIITVIEAVNSIIKITAGTTRSIINRITRRGLNKCIQ